MRLLNLIKGDIKFQIKYGFYFIYAIITAVYLFLLFAIPQNIRGTTAIILIFSDPAAMGMFFMGAIILLEKSQRVLNSIAISPTISEEYILAKIISLGLISTLVGIILTIAAGREHIILAAIGIFLGSAFFTMLGIIVGTMVSSLNQFFVATVPFEIIGMIPAIVLLFMKENELMMLHPGCLFIKLIMGENIGFHIVVLILWLVVVFRFTNRRVTKMFGSVGGVKL